MAKVRPQRRRKGGKKKTHRAKRAHAGSQKVIVGEQTREQERRKARRGEGESLKESTRWSRT